MNQEVLLWLIGLVVVLVSGAMSWLWASHIRLLERMSKLEAIFSMFSEKVANILHSPHTPDLDVLLEKYIDQHYELTDDEWRELQRLCLEIESDTEASKGERALAGWMSTVCSYKLLQEPPAFKKHEDMTKETPPEKAD